MRFKRGTSSPPNAANGIQRAFERVRYDVAKNMKLFEEQTPTG